jgi:hypothetical protein
MVFISESHDTKSAFKAFLVGMGDHMSSEMWIPFEIFTTIRLRADKRAVIRVFLIDMSEKMRIFVEGFIASWTCVVSRSGLWYFRWRSLEKDLLLGVLMILHIEWDDCILLCVSVWRWILDVLLVVMGKGMLVLIFCVGVGKNLLVN